MNQRKHNYNIYISYYAPTCFYTTVPSSASLPALPCKIAALVKINKVFKILKFPV